MASGEAHLWQHPQTERYYAMWEENGRTRRKSLKTTVAKTANKRLNKHNRDLFKGKIAPISKGLKIPFHEFVAEFLEFKEVRVATETHRMYKDALNKAKNVWGNIPTNHLTERHIETYLTNLLGADLKTPTINKNYRHLKSALKQAIKWGYMPPILEFPAPFQEEEQVRFLDVEEIHQLMAVIDDPEFNDFCMLAAYSGLRSGEMIRLAWRDVDNPPGFFRITAKQKNKKESRVPIHGYVRGILERCKARNWVKVFRFRSRTDISHTFKKFVRLAGLRDELRFHDLRHTYASHLSMKGEDIRAIQKLMRHKSMASTLIYADLSPDYLKEVNSSLDFGPLPINNGKKKEDP
jgi:integrase